MAKANRWDDYFSKRLKREREARGLSQGELVKLLEEHGVHIHPSAIAKIEASTRSVKLDEAAAVAEVLGLSLDALLGRGDVHDERSHALTTLARDARAALDLTYDLSDRLRASYAEVSAAFDQDEAETRIAGGQFTRFPDGVAVDEIRAALVRASAGGVSGRIAELHEALRTLYTVTAGSPQELRPLWANLMGMTREREANDGR